MTPDELIGGSSSPVVGVVRGDVGWLVLNRPNTINALDAEMVDLLRQHLEEWNEAGRVGSIVICATGSRGFCAGGDIRQMHRALAEGRTEEFADFLRRQYDLDLAIATSPIPVVTILDGLVLGGGVGIGAHAQVRVVTDRSRIGMPEAKIGFVPDAGGSFLLGRAPGRIGEHLGLTGRTVGAADAIYCGFADHHVPYSALGVLLQEIGKHAASETRGIVERHTVPAGDSPLLHARSWIDECYGRSSVDSILEALHESAVDAARDAAVEIGRNSPLSTDITLEVIRAARGGEIHDALDREWRTARVLLEGDVSEGIRAQLIDKDHAPVWPRRDSTDAVRMRALIAAAEPGTNPPRATPLEEIPSSARRGARTEAQTA